MKIVEVGVINAEETEIEAKAAKSVFDCNKTSQTFEEQLIVNVGAPPPLKIKEN